MSAQKVYVTKCFTFEAAHRLPNYDGKCANLHGHTYRLEVTFSGVKDFLIHGDQFNGDKATDYMVVDFTKIKKVINEYIVNLVDHSYLNETFNMPTAEVMCVYFYYTIRAVLEELKGSNSDYLDLYSVKLWETPDSYALYCGETD